MRNPSFYYLVVFCLCFFGNHSSSRAQTVNEPPTVSLFNTIGSLPENTNTASRIKVADVDIIDDALGANVLSLSGPDASSFELDGLELYLKAGTILDYETQSTFDVTVEVDDATVGSAPDDSAVLTLMIEDVNEAPSVSLAQAINSLPENTNTASRIKVADVDIFDDALGANVLSLSGPDASSFELDGLELYLKAGTSLDFETQSTFDVTVEVDDATVGSAPDDAAVFTLMIEDLNEPPSVPLVNAIDILPENTGTASRIKIADIVVRDDALGTNVLSLAGPDASSFELDGLQLYLKAGTSLDFETQSTLQVTVEVDDATVGSAPNDSAVLTLIIEDVNEPPTVTLGIAIDSLPENTDTASRIKIADIAVDDDTLGTNVLSLSGPDAGSFELDGLELYLKAGTSLDFETQSTLQVTVEVDDATIGSAPDDSADLTLMIEDVNEPPTVTLDVAIDSPPENTDTASRIKIADIAVDDDALGTNVLSLSGPDAGSFELDGLELYLKAGTSLDFETQSTLQVTVEVDDATIGSAPDDSADLTLMIEDVNEPPTVTLDVAIDSPPENTDTASRIKIADIAVDDDALSRYKCIEPQWSRCR